MANCRKCMHIHDNPVDVKVDQQRNIVGEPEWERGCSRGHVERFNLEKETECTEFMTWADYVTSLPKCE